MEPLVSWLRVWAWSPVLPAPLLAGFAPLLAALRRARPDGPPDPRSAARLRSRHRTTIELEDLLERVAAAGALAAAAALAGAPDAGASGYVTVLQRVVAADPAAWTADVPAVLAALVLPELGAFYLAAPPQPPRAVPRSSRPARPRPCSPPSRSAAPCPHLPTPTSRTRAGTQAGRGPAC
ncbi:hypothetical protein [Streptomyces olivaceoviridis]|uniref:hypothetical protein n=1 Tax=Streptomyces olivaceoviridis TaxID=1921 RepID=UPI00379B9ED3